MSLRMICFQIKYLVQYGWNGSPGLMKRKKGGSRVEEILKRRAIGEWLGLRGDGRGNTKEGEVVKE